MFVPGGSVSALIFPALFLQSGSSACLYTHDFSIHDPYPPVRIGCQIVVVGNHDQGLASLLYNPLHEPQNLHGGAGIQISRGLVRKYNLGIHHQGPRNAYPLLLAAGHLRRHVLRLIFDPYQFHIMQRLLKSFLSGNASERKGKGYIFHRVHGRKQIVGLENKPHILPAEGHKLFFRKPLYMRAADEDLSLGGLLQSCHHVEQRGFP